MNIVFKDFGIARKFKERWRGFPRKQTQTRAFLPLTEENDNQVASAPIPRLGFSSRALMEDKYFLKCILVPISVAGILQCATATKALEFELKGTLETEGHLAFGKVMQGETVNFTASVQNCNWLVRVSSAKPTEAQTYRQISCNGREMYVIGVNAKVGGASSWGGSVAPEGVPFYGPVTTLPVLWLAFGASCFYSV